jgi:hypothetical protein
MWVVTEWCISRQGKEKCRPQGHFRQGTVRELADSLRSSRDVAKQTSVDGLSRSFSHQYAHHVRRSGRAEGAVQRLSGSSDHLGGYVRDMRMRVCSEGATTNRNCPAFCFVSESFISEVRISSMIHDR